MATGNPTTTTTSDWLEFYHPTLAQQVSSTQPSPPLLPQIFRHSSAVADATVVTTTAMANAPGLDETITFASGRVNTGSPYPNVEGRVGKASRRRSRASRRAPTTLLNTDATNFRAMVQQFTGIPTGPFSSQYPRERSDFSFATREHHRRLDVNAMMIPSGQHHLHQQQQQQQQLQQQLRHHQQQQQQMGDEQLMLLRDNNDGFFTNPRATFEFSDGFLDNIPSHVRPRPTSTDSRVNGYIL